MVLNSKFLPVVALGIALTFLWCYPEPNSVISESGFSEKDFQVQESSRPATLQSSRNKTSCEVCRIFVAKTANSDSLRIGLLKAPPISSSPVDFTTSGVSYQAIDIISSKRFALYRSSLFHQAVLIRI